MNAPDILLKNVAQEYNSTHGLGKINTRHFVPVDTELAHTIAQAYAALPVLAEDRETVRAYLMLAVEIAQQWDFLLKRDESCGLLTMEPWTQEGQPYANSAEMCQDVRDNLHLFFFTGGEPHPFLGEIGPDGLSLNDKFRAVHDIFGHAAMGFEFGPRGEENAWIHHSMMFSPLAQRALSTETRGQNSWFNFGPYSHLPARERPFADQKTALLPESLTDWRQALARG